MSSFGRVQVTEMPQDIREQELEIELMCRHLVRFGNSGSSHSLQGCSDIALKQEATVWILILVLVFICIFGCYLFWLKASGDPTEYQALRTVATRV
jgi:hypothetical protein